jgi:predicted lipoprotein with Yx(FWY)xxD motif
MTLYLFVPDETAEGSTCQGTCAATWPPLTVDGEPAAGDNVTADLGTFQRQDSGEMQVTANDWPLYTFVEDEEPGDVTGQGFDEDWWTLSPDGTANRDPSG